ncbi:MAG: FlgD immunoglobulin-like domain containing protein [Bacteroidota bacterium]|nr:FlgD immunoglobulin-like domain containing protein [Bacteroidota bacterium]
MFSRCVNLVVLLLSILSSSLFAQWSDIIQITSEKFDHEMPVFASYLPIYGPSSTVDYLVFTRKDSVGSNICVKKTVEYGKKWDDNVTYITSDSFVNTSPSIARRLVYPTDDKIMIVWQSNRNGNNNIYYSLGNGVTWSTPNPITTEPMDDINPSVGVYGTTFIVSWESNGLIKSSLFLNNRWSDAINVSDSNFNSSPKISSSSWEPSVVFWDKKLGDSVQILYSIFKNNIWSVPKLFKTIDDKSNLSITKIFDNFGNIQVTWDQRGETDIEVYGRSSDFNFDTLRWSVESNLSQAPLTHNKNASSIFIPIIWKEAKHNFYFDVLAFEDSSNSNDQIRAKCLFMYEDEIFNTNGLDKNPAVSCGVLDEQTWPQPFNVWVVWQTNESGRWQLAGSYLTITAWGVEDDNTPEIFKLNQNYPNPFNYGTSIPYSIDKPINVNLEIFNLLGIRVKVFSEMYASAGEYQFYWDGKNESGIPLPSGVYYYRLSSGIYFRNRSMILLK